MEFLEDTIGVYRLVEEENGTPGEEGYEIRTKKDYVICYICQSSTVADDMMEEPNGFGFVHQACLEDFQASREKDPIEKIEDKYNQSYEPKENL